MKIFFVIAAVLICISASTAQTQLEYYSDTPTDARSAALGEAFVAAATGTSAMFYNVAGLASQQGIAFSYETRNEFYDNPNNLYRQLSQSSFTATISTGAAGNFGVRYSALAQNTNAMSVSGATGQNLGMFTTQLAIPDFALAYAGALSPTLDGGIGVGIVGYNDDLTAATKGGASISRHSTAPYATFGIRYHESILKSATPDEFSFAASLDHLGALLVHSDSVLNSIDLARSLRAGISWHIVQPDTTPWADEFLSGLITGQFKKVLNQPGYTANGTVNNAGYWSLGLELGVYRIFFLRYGLQYRPFDSEFAYRNSAQRNLGFGADVPLQKIFRFAWPVRLNIDYTVMSLLNNRAEHLFTAGIHLDHDFFPAPPSDDQAE